jgi:hypothetical protein
MNRRPYGVHFRRHTTRDVQAIYGDQMTRVRNGQAALIPTLQEANKLMNQKVEYGDCQPYKGLGHPIQPKP